MEKGRCISIDILRQVKSVGNQGRTRLVDRRGTGAKQSPIWRQQPGWSRIVDSASPCLTEAITLVSGKDVENVPHWSLKLAAAFVVLKLITD
jgi:hypothetical protein